DEETRTALASTFPDQADTIDRLARLLNERPQDPAQLEVFFELIGTLAAPAEGQPDVHSEASMLPAMLTEDPKIVCQEFLTNLEDLGVGYPEEDNTATFGPLGRLWNGAREALRQATYFQMKQRAGHVGQTGLAPILTEIQRDPHGVRIHLVGHSFGARLVSFAVKALPDSDSNSCVKSVTLLQAAFSHFAFADSLPFPGEGGGALAGVQSKVGGPLTACFSEHDDAVGTFYPIASRLSGDDTSGLSERLYRWGALGHDGFQGIDGVPGLSIESLGANSNFRYPTEGYFNIDASAVVSLGGPPSGAHSDICHPELAWVVLKAGQII
ncbi:serine-threonine protein kinase, partial [Streptomyces erythrochromogenes]